MAGPVQEIEAQIAGVKTAAAKQNVGIVREIGDGVAKIEGLSDVMLNEMLEFGGGVFGLALNLEETEVGAILLGDDTQLQEGDEVKTTGKLLSVPVGKGLLGRVVNTLGQPVDGKGPIDERRRLSGREDRARHHQAEIRQPAGADRHHGDRRDDPDRPRPARADHRRPRDRQDDDRHRHDHQPGAHQQGGRRAGDTSFRPLYSIYVGVGQKQSNVARIIAVLEEAGAMPYTIIVPRRPPTPPRTNTSRRSPAQRWASGSWITAWTR